MLKFLRKKGVMKKLLWAIAIVIILVFGVLGQMYLLDDSNGTRTAGKIFNRPVSLEEFQAQWQQTRIQALIQFGQNYYRIRDFLDLDGEAWDRLILLHEANRQNIKVPDQAIVKHIQSFPFFQRDGKFEPLLYNDILKHTFQMSPRQFEEGIRDSLKLAELYKRKTQDVTIEEKEIFEAYQLENRKIQVHYALFPTQNFLTQVTVDKEAVRRYFDAHKNDFIRPPMIKVEYLKALNPPVTTTPEEANPDENAPAEKSPEDDATKPVVAKQPETPAVADDTEDARSLLTSIAEDIASLENPDFSKIASTHDIIYGTTTFFSEEQPDMQPGWTFAALQKVFALDDQTISSPLEAKDGYLLVRVIERQPSHLPEFADIQGDVTSAWQTTQAQERARQKARQALDTFREAYTAASVDFKAAATEMNLDVYTTPVFHQGQYLPKLGVSQPFQTAAFQLTQEAPLSQDVVLTEAGATFLYLAKVIPVDQEAYNQAKDVLREKILKQKKDIAFNEYLTELRWQADIENYLEKPATQGKTQSARPETPTATTP